MRNLVVFLAILHMEPLFAQTLTLENSRHFKLSDSTPAIVLPASACANCYYYLPTHFRVAATADGRPELSLLKISETDEGPITGGILHALLVWGLNAAQEAELTKTIRARLDSVGVLVGTASVVENGSGAGLVIAGADSLALILQRSLQSKSGPATTPGSKMAMSFRLDENDVQYLIKAIENPKFKSESCFEIELTTVVDSAGGFGQKQVDLKLQLPVTSLFKWLRPRR